MVSQPFRDLLAAGVWASSASALKDPPEDHGLDRSHGWGIAHEQVGSEELPELEVFNQQHYEIGSALRDIAAQGVLAWDPDLDYVPTAEAHCFVTTVAGLWVSGVPSGPGRGGAVDPETEAQTTWRRY